MSEYSRPLYQIIASTVDALHRCEKTPGHEWIARHQDVLNHIADNLLPSGSGIDNGTAIDWKASTGDKIVLSLDFHHMDESGGYDGWTKHQITVRPSLIHTIELTINGRNRNGIKEYLYDVLYSVLTERYTHRYDSIAEVHDFSRVA